MQTASDGVCLGEVSDGAIKTPVRMTESDRARHCYVVGSTGTGKSTLLANLILQDIHNGEGVTVIDPHGDLYRQILASLPPHRYADLVLFDATDAKNTVGLNFLECDDDELQIHFVINEMLKIFYRLYDRQMMGPMFETYMRTAMVLLLDRDDRPPVTLVDIPRVFEDAEYRREAKAACRNRMAADFWTHAAEKSSGDWSLANFAAYIISKLNAFIYNGRMRRIISCEKSTINLHEVLQQRRIMLVNLSKGVIGELDSQFLGMMLLGKLFQAALARASEPEEKRVPHYLYVDEFQNFATDTLAYMMAEARKFGLRLILANQTLNQVATSRDHSDQNLMQAVLGNVGSLAVFRVGAPDADKFETYTRPEYAGQDLQYLPDYHAVGRLLVQGKPLRPFVFQTVPFRHAEPPADLASAIERARALSTEPAHPQRAKTLAEAAKIQGDMNDRRRTRAATLKQLIAQQQQSVPPQQYY